MQEKMKKHEVIFYTSHELREWLKEGKAKYTFTEKKRH